MALAVLLSNSDAFVRSFLGACAIILLFTLFIIGLYLYTRRW
jgi:hypothetical protein